MASINRKMKHILLILKEPFLDRIPSLKTLILFLLNQGYYITLITSQSSRFTLISFTHENLKIVKVKQRTKKIEPPTTIKLVRKTFWMALRHRFDYIMGGDSIGNIIASNISRLVKKKHIFFMLEYPQIVTTKYPILSKSQVLENKSLERSDIIITHDIWHKRFLLDHFNINESNVFLLPNSTFTPKTTIKGSFLQKEFHLTSQNVVLHSGGFGKWFRCKELADSTVNWSRDIKLIFHLSHKMEGDDYFTSVYNGNYQGRVLFSLNPVSTYELDDLISSADIGIALYSESELEYRATFMGLAAGKIGNYLKCGIPIIATKLQSLTYIEEYHCGVLVDDESEIAYAIQKILSEYKLFSQNAYRCYDELWYPKPYLLKIAKALS